MGNLLWIRCVKVNARAVVGIRLALQIGGQRCNLLRREAVVGHGRGCIVDARIPKPGSKPFRLGLVADARQFWTHIAPDDIASGILHRVARGAERFSIEARPS